MSPSTVATDLGVYEASATQKGHHTIGLIHVTCRLNNGLVTPNTPASLPHSVSYITAH